VPETKRYDRAYFDRWYHDPRHSVVHQDLLGRRVQLAIAAAEYLLERPIRNVLDVGCGEARWRAWILRARPKVRYVGVDSSEYVLRRYGKSRDIRQGSLGTLGRMKLPGRFDLIVCSDVLHYVATPELRAGLRAIARRLRGMAFLEAFPREDDTVGDDVGYQKRAAATYRRLFREAGLVRLGLHCYAGPALADRLTTLERAEG
jgi:SAM-dependent methyltransferase